MRSNFVLSIYMLNIFFFILSVNAEEEPEAQSRLRRQIKYRNEKSLYAQVQLGNGSLFLRKTTHENLFSGEFLFSDRPPIIAYETIGREGRLSVKMVGKYWKHKFKPENYSKINHSMDFDKLYANKCDLNFSDQIPLSLRMDLGIVKGDLDLGGLQISTCKLKAAIGRMTVDFKHSNPISMENLEIENKMGALQILSLCNANFEEFDFSAGVGAYTLDFGGTLTRDALANIEIGLGSLEILLPRNIGIRIKVDRAFFSTLAIDEMHEKNGYYYNQLWGQSVPKLDIYIESGVAKVSIQWLNSSPAPSDQSN